MGTDTHIVVDGYMVSQRISNIIEAIRDYSPELNVEWCPPALRQAGQAAFKITHTPPDGNTYTIFHVKTEEEFDQRVLLKIIAGDQRNGELKYSELEAAEETAKRLAHQTFLDSLEEANEIAAAVMKSNKSTYKVNDNLIIKDYLPGNHAKKKRHF